MTGSGDVGTKQQIQKTSTFNAQIRGTKSRIGGGFTDSTLKWLRIASF